MGTWGLSGMPDRFFDERTDQSEVKARIIQKYFFAWAQAIMPTAEKFGRPIAYIDLYCGPGRYKDGAASTPLLVLEHAIKHPRTREMLVSFFNDSDNDKTETLSEEINSLPGIQQLRHRLVVSCSEVNEEAELYFAKTRLVPSFSFIDPFGYKGLSLKIVNGVIKDCGCDCVFFFNYGRINAELSNPAVQHHIEALFGEQRTKLLKERLGSLKPMMREALILEELAQAIREMGGKFVLPFLRVLEPV
jgi:three-Cys-motif partner protein